MPQSVEDEFYWIALTTPSDMYSQMAARFDEFFSAGAVYTTEEVLTELPAFFATDRWLGNRAVKTVRQIVSDPAVHVIPRSPESGFGLYAARPDKGYSLTDCISMQAMRTEGLTGVLTNDRHFEREGFRALFRES